MQAKPHIIKPSHFTEIVNALPYACFIVAKTQAGITIQVVNKVAKTLTRMPILRGMNLIRVLRQPELLALVDQALETQERQSSQFTDLPHINAQEVCATPLASHIHLSPLAAHRAPIKGLVMISIINISTQTAAQKSRRGFVANVSHELRSPLTSLSSIVETLQTSAKGDPETQAHFLDIMAREISRMTRLVGDLLSLAQLESDQYLPLVENKHNSDVNIADIISDVIISLCSAKPEWQERIHFLPPKTTSTLHADADQMRTVFQNLIENALNYGSADKPVNIEITMPTPNYIDISIRDQGEGIAREHLPHLTERFYRIDQGRSREMGGTGLGLAITKYILNRHKATLRINSEQGVGTEILVSLPIHI